MNPPACVNCRFIVGAEYTTPDILSRRLAFRECHYRPQKIKPKKFDPVSGIVEEERKEFLSCSDSRTPRWLFCRLERKCGKEGRFFEPRPDGEELERETEK